MLVAVGLTFTGTVWRWQGGGPAAWFFVTLPEADSEALRAASKLVGPGWGMVPVRVRVGETEWETSLFPNDGRYLLPLKASVRKAEGLEEHIEVSVQLEVR